MKPNNISVLSEENLAAKIYSLMTVLKGLTEIEILCVNSRESFESNKKPFRKALESEIDIIHLNSTQNDLLRNEILTKGVDVYVNGI